MKKVALIVWLYLLIFWGIPLAGDATGIVNGDWLNDVYTAHVAAVIIVVMGASFLALMREIEG